MNKLLVTVGAVVVALALVVGGAVAPVAAVERTPAHSAFTGGQSCNSIGCVVTVAVVPYTADFLGTTYHGVAWCLVETGGLVGSPGSTANYMLSVVPVAPYLAYQVRPSGLSDGPEGNRCSAYPSTTHKIDFQADRGSRDAAIVAHGGPASWSLLSADPWVGGQSCNASGCVVALGIVPFSHAWSNGTTDVGVVWCLKETGFYANGLGAANYGLSATFEPGGTWTINPDVLSFDFCASFPDATHQAAFATTDGALATAFNNHGQPTTWYVIGNAGAGRADGNVQTYSQVPTFSDGANFDVACKDHPTWAWDGNWLTWSAGLVTWVTYSVSYYTTCLFLPKNGWDPHGDVGRAWMLSPMGVGMFALANLANDVAFTEDCGFIVNGDLGPLGRLAINTCDWVGWASPMKQFLGWAFVLWSAFQAITFVIRQVASTVGVHTLPFDEGSGN